MKQRDAILVLGAVLLAVGITAVFLVGTLSAPERNEGRPAFFFGQTRVAPQRVENAQRAPDAIRPIVPLQRGVSDGARDAAGYLLVMLGVSAALVLAREPVLASYHAAQGDRRAQVSIVGTGLAVVALAASAAFLVTVIMLSAATVGPFGRNGPFGSPQAFLFQPFLQSGFTAVTVAMVFVALVALVGFSAAAWRLGDLILGLRPLRRWATSLPTPLTALLGSTLVYLAAQVPFIGPAVWLLAVAYALGVAITARLGHTHERAITSSL
ncbi:MAG: hypothetical protein HY071_07080 [Chloroflexi bacterium]|nr:hypothetical protein [Chloroflexota bacterium]